MIKLFVEFGPVVVFLITYKYSDILLATKLMILVTIFCLLLSYVIDRKVSIPLLLSAFILIILGSITVLTGNSEYIKMKPTIVYVIFSSALYLFAKKEKPLMKDLLGQVISLKDEDWLTLSKRFAVYFLSMAIINEIVWRNFSDNVWVNFKVFGALPITVIFFALQLPFIMRNQIDKV
jgi:intracellular septation protein